jgi:hypothetical protein
MVLAIPSERNDHRVSIEVMADRPRLNNEERGKQVFRVLSIYLY